MSERESLKRGSRSHATPSSRSRTSTSASRSNSSRPRTTSSGSRTSGSQKRASSSRSRSSSAHSRSHAPRTTSRRASDGHSTGTPIRQSTRARSQISSRPIAPSPFESLLKSVVTASLTGLRNAFFGEVDASLRGHKISSVDAHQRVKNRLRWTFLILIFVLVVTGLRVVQLQTVQRGKYLAASVDQRTRINTVRASRGVIFDRNGNELALSVPSTTIYADPREITDPIGTARSLAAVLALTPEQEAKMAEQFAKPGSKFHYVARELDEVRAQTVLQLGLTGIYSYTEPVREVEGGVAQNVIGKTDPDGLGTSGLELQYNKTLTGQDGKIIREVDKRGRTIAGAGKTTAAPVPGDDMVLTLDKNIQFHTDSALLDRVGQLGAKGGTAIVMNSKTGEIYSMSNVRRNAEGAAIVATGNFAAVEAFEPGSVSKVFSLSAAVNEGVATPETVIKVPGIKVIDNYPIRDAWPHPTMDMDLRTIFSKSSNIGTLLMASKISTQKLHDYLAKFGFGQKTGLNYPGESSGKLRPANKWRGTEQFTVSYGYGMSATSLQMVAAVNAVANKGTYVAPKLVSALLDKNGKRKEVKSAPSHEVVKPETAAVMADMMHDVVCTGTGTLAQVKGMEVAGKTGTGYKAQSNGTYVDALGNRRYFASFVGFFPAKNPEVTMLVSIDEPNADSRDRFGGTAAAPVFSRLVPHIMHELNIEATGTGTGCTAGSTPAGH